MVGEGAAMLMGGGLVLPVTEGLTVFSCFFARGPSRGRTMPFASAPPKPVGTRRWRHVSNTPVCGRVEDGVRATTIVVVDRRPVVRP